MNKLPDSQRCPSAVFLGGVGTRCEMERHAGGERHLGYERADGDDGESVDVEVRWG